MSDTRSSFWGYVMNNKGYKSGRFARHHNNIYTRNSIRPTNDGSEILKAAQDGWNYMSNYIKTGKGND